MVINNGLMPPNRISRSSTFVGPLSPGPWLESHNSAQIVMEQGE
jgi:hypothetical protein